MAGADIAPLYPSYPQKSALCLLHFIDALRPTLNPNPMTRILITGEIIAELKSLYTQSGMKLGVLLKSRSDVPKGLSAMMIKLWLNGEGQSARREHLAYVLRVWRESEEQITISDEQRCVLKSELNRTGVTILSLVRMIPDTGYRKAPARVIRSWVSGGITTAHRPIFDLLISTLAALPTGNKPQKVGKSRTSKKREPFTEKHRKLLFQEFDRTRVTYKGLLQDYSDPTA